MKAKSYIFRQARADEAETVASLYDAVKKNPFTVWTENYPLLEDAENDLRLGELFVLCDGDRIIGAISGDHDEQCLALEYWKEHSHCIEIARVCVDPEYQGQGLSLLLVNEFEKAMKERGLTSLHLLVSEANVPAFRTYMKAGFTVIARTFIYGHDYCLCEKMI